MELILAFIGAYLVYALQKYLYKSFWRKNISVELLFSKDAALEGEELSLLEVVTNRKLLPLPVLQVKFMSSRNLEYKDFDNSKVSDNFYRNDIISVMPYQKVTRTLPFVCAHRGYYSINRMDIVCSNLFMTREEVAVYDMNVNLYVYPKPVDLSRFDAVFIKMLGTVLTKRFINEDPFEFRNIREYQSYDSLKLINWKASAKTDTLKVNVHDYTSSQQVKIIMNVQAETIWKYDDLSEEGIRIASALAYQFIEQGIPVSIYSNAKDINTDKSIIVPAGSGKSHFRIVQEALARIDLSLEASTFYPMLQEELSRSSNKDYVVLISYNQKEEFQQLMLQQIPSKKEFAWIVPMNKEVRVTLCDELSSRVIPWETEEDSRK